MKAVLMTDVFQSLLMFAAIFSVIVCAAMETGSLTKIWNIAERGNRTYLLKYALIVHNIYFNNLKEFVTIIHLHSFSPDPTVRHSWFTLIIGGGVTFISLYGVNQTQVQRYLTLKDLKSAQRALWLHWPILTLLSLTTSFSGLAIYSKYYNCDPVIAGAINNRDQVSENGKF